MSQCDPEEYEPTELSWYDALEEITDLEGPGNTKELKERYNIKLREQSLDRLQTDLPPDRDDVDMGLEAWRTTVQDVEKTDLPREEMRENEKEEEVMNRGVEETSQDTQEGKDSTGNEELLLKTAAILFCATALLAITVVIWQRQRIH